MILYMLWMQEVCKDYIKVMCRCPNSQVQNHTASHSTRRKKVHLSPSPHTCGSESSLQKSFTLTRGATVSYIHQKIGILPLTWTSSLQGFFFLFSFKQKLLDFNACISEFLYIYVFFLNFSLLVARLTLCVFRLCGWTWVIDISLNEQL